MFVGLFTLFLLNPLEIKFCFIKMFLSNLYVCFKIVGYRFCSFGFLIDGFQVNYMHGGDKTSSTYISHFCCYFYVFTFMISLFVCSLILPCFSLRTISMICAIVISSLLFLLDCFFGFIRLCQFWQTYFNVKLSVLFPY